MPFMLSATASWRSQAPRITGLMWLAALVFAFWPISGAQAQVPPTAKPPDAGTLNQQIERERQATPLPRAAPPLTPAETAPLKLPEGATVTVKSFKLAGNRLLADARLLPVLLPYLDRPLGFNELAQAAQAVATAYREAGWIVRTYLPRQDVTDGVITIQVIEAVFSGARVTAPQDVIARVKPAQVQAIVDAQQKTGDPLSASALDRALLLVDDLPGVAASGALEAGTQEGGTGLLLQLNNEPLLSGEAAIDHHGARSTGSSRATLTASLASPLGLGDQLRGDALHSEGSDYLRVAWGLPLPGRLGAQGWRISANVSKMNYRLVAAEFAGLRGRGDSLTTGLELSYPVIRSRMRNLFFSVAYDDKRFHNEANGVTQSHYGVGATTLGLSSNVYDNLGGGGANSFALAWQDGRVRQGAVDLGENTALNGHWNKLRYSASRVQVLSPNWSILAAVNGQQAGRDLDSSERFYLGGPQGVRAYPVNEGSGSQGHLLNLELRWRPHDTVTVAGFYDWGRVSSHDQTPPLTYKGAGASLSWSAPHGVNLKLTWARRDGANPNPTAAGLDQDGSFKRNRLWVQASVAF